MGREEGTLHKASGFKYALIASVLFAIAVLVQIYVIFQIVGGGYLRPETYFPVFKMVLTRQSPAILAYIFVAITLIRGKRDLLPVMAVAVLGFASVILLFAGGIMSTPAKLLLVIGRLSLLAIIGPGCTNCEQEAKALAKRCFFVPAVFMAATALLIDLFHWGDGSLFVLIEAAGMLFAAIWAVNGTEIQRTTGTTAKNEPFSHGSTVENIAYCGLVKHILLLIFTFGIWYLIWIYRMTGYLNQIKDEPERNPATTLLLCMFVPFYSIYWVYKSAQRIDKLAAHKGVRSDLSTPCLILAIFVGIIPPIFMQDKINEIVTAGNRDRQAEVYAARPVSNKENFGAAEELKTYKELFDSGVITQEEFDAKKKQLLNL